MWRLLVVMLVLMLALAAGNNNADAAVTATAKRMDDMDNAVLEEAINRSLPLTEPVGREAGMMDASVWPTAQTVLPEQGLARSIAGYE